MILSGADITSVLEGVGSAPPSSDDAGARILSTLTNASSKVLQFNRPSTAQMSLDEIFALLNDMTLPQTILDQAQPVFSKTGFLLETAKAFAQYDAKTARPYTAATRGEVKLALLHLPFQFFDNPKAWGSFGDFIENIDGRVKLVAPGRGVIPPGFNGFLKISEKRGKNWTFVPWDWVEAFLTETDTIEQVFDLPELTDRGTGLGGSSILKFKPEDRQIIIDIFVFWAANFPSGGKEFFENLVSGANWPKEFKDNIAGRWGGNPTTDAMRLLDYLIEQNRIPAGEPNTGDTYLGWVLNARLKSLGNPNRKNIARIIVDYKLLTHEEDLKDPKKFKSEG